MRLFQGGVALVIVAGALYYLWPDSRTTDSSSTENAPGQSAKERTQQQRLRNDANGLARAFSMMAARTMGTVVVSGQVRDRQSGAGIAEAEVIFTGPSGESSVLTDGQGNYQTELLPGLYRSYAQAEGYVAVARAAAQRLPGPVSAAAVAMPREGIAPLVGVFRDQRDVHLSLTAAARIEGKVVDSEGYPISGAVIASRGSGDVRVISGSDVSESDGNGAYQLLVPAGSIQLEASHQQYAALETAGSSYLSPGQVLRRDLVLVAGCIIEGEVIDAQGRAVTSGSFERKHVDGSYTPIGEIDNGAVRFATVREGAVTLRAWPWQSPHSEDQTFQCTDGAHYADQTFVIPDSTPALTGTVTDDDGEPIAYAYVDLFGLSPGGATQQERADSGGGFGFFALPDGPYQLSVYVPGKGAILALADVPSTGVPLRLGGTGAIVGSISGFDNGAMTIRYRCVFDLGASEMARSDAISMPEQTLLVPITSNKFRIDDVPACPIVGMATASGFAQPFRVTVVRNQDAILRLSTSSP